MLCIIIPSHASPVQSSKTFLLRRLSFLRSRVTARTAKKTDPTCTSDKKKDQVEEPKVDTYHCFIHDTVLAVAKESIDEQATVVENRDGSLNGRVKKRERGQKDATDDWIWRGEYYLEVCSRESDLRENQAEKTRRRNPDG